MVKSKLRPTGATLAIGVAILCLCSPFFIPATVLPFGFGMFFCWAVLCVASVLADRLLFWAGLSCSALFVVSIDWWIKGPPPTDEFGFGAIDAIALFTGAALVVAGTGALSVIRASMNKCKS